MENVNFLLTIYTFGYPWIGSKCTLYYLERFSLDRIEVYPVLPGTVSLLYERQHDGVKPAS